MAQHDVDAKIGQALRRIRREKSLTVTQLSNIADVSSGMISRIENGQVSPSLTTLDALARGLEVPLMSLFAHTSSNVDVHHVQKGEGLASKRVFPGHVHDYTLLGKHVDRGGAFESVRVTIRRDEAKELPRYQHEGFVFLYVVSGEAVYSCAGQEFPMSEGTSLSFDGKIPYGFTQIISDEVVMISVSIKPL
ncbi:MAG: helix-turn-helix domain-containing protein [Silicimonas sp.]|nr:helix-turn-helix domain-containing protein [Silicimonas sp.]